MKIKKIDWIPVYTGMTRQTRQTIFSYCERDTKKAKGSSEKKLHELKELDSGFHKSR